jgi:hypothetical protein
MREVNLEPTAEGYGNILLLFVQGILQDVPKKRLQSDAKIMVQILELAVYLSNAAPEELAKTKRWLETGDRL